jgi:hypothetical protein
VTTAEIAHRAPPAPRAPLRLAVLQHEPETGLGALAGVLGAFGVAYDILSTHEPLPTVVEYDGAIDTLFADLPDRISVFSFHEHSFGLAPHAIPLAGSLRCTHHAFRFGVAAYGFQFHPEVRAEDVGRWSDVPGYRRLVTENDGDWSGLPAALEQVTPELDRLANELLNRWLHLAAAVKTLRERPRLAA